MKILKFILSGKTAFFKKPEVNTYYSFTYGNIHKVAMLGIFGSILGYGGYGQMKKGDIYPEFYEKLKDLQISVVPLPIMVASEEKNRRKRGNYANGYIPKKIQSFNNSVGYASKEAGGNLIIKEQWLENPRWEIYLKLDTELALQIADSVLSKKCVFIPYLGKNDHPADISDFEIMDGELPSNEVNEIHSLFPKNCASIDLDEDIEYPFKYEESLPIALDKERNMYEHQCFVFTNMAVKRISCETVYVNDKYIVFY